MKKLIEEYKVDVLKKKKIYDEEQIKVIDKLDNLFNIVLDINKSKTNFFSFNLFNSIEKDKLLGLYIWGDVGRGKTYLVDLFFHLLPIKYKLRWHFHHFMTYVHNSLKKYSGEVDPLQVIAKSLSKDYIVICLDEFFVKDIGDAMILAKMLHYLFENKVILVFTSNVIPDNLYWNGLQRQKFLPAILLIKKNMDIINVDSKTDYRLRSLEKENVYLYPLSNDNFSLFKNLFFKLSAMPPVKNTYIEILGRKISVLYISGSIVWFDFNMVCGNGRSQLDYIEIATLFDTVFISELYSLGHVDDDKVRRFISLIDEFYDRKINVIINSDVAINDIYVGTDLIFDFRRTSSRLYEMGTREYLKDSDKYV